MNLTQDCFQTIFNSNLISLVPDHQLGLGVTHYAITTQFWIYLVTSIGLTLLTFLSTHCLNWRWSKAAGL